MGKRKGISASLRWAVFARDGFTCRYCGAQAGQDGVELHADHIVSVVDGGDNSIDNLATACQRCNGGKGAKSLSTAPTTAEVIDRLDLRSRTLWEQATAIQAAVAAERECEQAAVNLKCEAYETESVRMIRGEAKHITTLCRAYGADLVLEWYRQAAQRGVYESRAIKYVYGIIRKLREKGEIQ